MPCSVPSNSERCVALNVRRQVALVDREAMVLAGDQHAAGVQVLHRVVGAVVAELHLHGARAAGQAEQLVAQADAEGRDVRHDQLADGVDGVVAGRRIAGAVRQEHAVRLEREHFLGRGLRRHHGHAAAAVGEHAQDVVLDAVVVGDDVEALVRAHHRRSSGCHSEPSFHW